MRETHANSITLHHRGVAHFATFFTETIKMVYLPLSKLTMPTIELSAADLNSWTQNILPSKSTIPVISHTMHYFPMHATFDVQLQMHS